MKKINNYYVVLLASCSAFMCAMDDTNAMKLGVCAQAQKPVACVGANGTSIPYNPKIYVPRDAAGKPLVGGPNYHEIVKQQDAAHAEGNNLLMAASLKALEELEKKAKL